MLKQTLCIVGWMAVALLAAGCARGVGDEATAVPLSLPNVEPVALNGRPLRVVATTSIIGDVVANVGGEAVDLITLMSAGQDPHSYEPSAGDLTRAADADVIFVNGWNLEEGLVDDLATIAEGAVMAPVSANITALEGKDGRDPHTWLDPHNVIRWTENIAAVLSGLDPANADRYRGNAEAYQAQLEALINAYDAQLGAIPPERRKLVTNHDAFAYLAAAYDLEIIGTVIPGASTIAEPSASGLARLAADMDAAGVCALFVETTANTDLATAVAGELPDCDAVSLRTLYSGALGSPGSGAESYLTMMEANLEEIVAGLQMTR